MSGPAENDEANSTLSERDRNVVSRKNEWLKKYFVVVNDQNKDKIKCVSCNKCFMSRSHKRMIGHLVLEKRCHSTLFSTVAQPRNCDTVLFVSECECDSVCVRG